MKLHPVLTDKQRFPLLDDLRFLGALRQDRRAPRFNFRSGDRLDKEALERVRAYACEADSAARAWNVGDYPSWLERFIKWSTSTVPAYRGRSARLEEHPSLTREDLRRTPWEFVSDNAKIEDLLVYSTSGTTGPPLDVNFDCVTAATYLVHLEQALAPYGISLHRGQGRVAIALICAQQDTLTYASVSQYLDGAGVLKLNLHPSQWKASGDREAYLEKWQPGILTGDPLAFSELAALDVEIRPQALVSSAMCLTREMRASLSKRFGCPVVDIYSLTECRMIAVGVQNGHELLRHDLYVEILHPEQDKALPPGQEGEITVTGGNNPFLPLIRYRTGDFGSLDHMADRVLLKGLTGRKPVRFVGEDGCFVNNVDVARALAPFKIPAFSLRQRRDASLVLVVYARVIAEAAIRDSLAAVFGAQVCIDVQRKDPNEVGRAKIVPYIQELP